MEQVIITTVTLVVGGLFGLAVTSVFLRAATKWVEKRDLSFGSAMGTTALLLLSGLLVGGVISGIVYAATRSMEAVNFASLFINWPLGFAIQSGIIGWRLSISYSRGCLIWLAMQAVTIFCCLSIALIVGVMSLMLQ